jgi:hypothetical protein
MKNQRNLILPEELVIEIMGMVAQLGNVAAEYHMKINNSETEEVTRVYRKILKKLMDLTEHDKTGYLSLEEICNEYGIRLPNKGDHNGNH